MKIRDLTHDEMADLDRRLSYHPPHGDQAQRYGALRGAFKGVGSLMMQMCPQSRELSVALTHLETALMWSNAAIARNEPPPAEGD